MKVVCFSSFTFAYLNRARVLFSTLRRFHPDWTLVALVTDHPPLGVPIALEPELFDRIVYAEDLEIPNFRSWIFQHDVVEACTAVKGPFVTRACSGDADVVIYLDPDTALFSRLDPVLEILESSEIVLTPHLLSPETTRNAVLDNEISALKTGIFNLGFIALRTSEEGRRFARWWRDRLLEHCFNDVARGLFTDQRWCDHVPVFFEGVKILRDPGYNVASWNLNGRRIAIGPDGSATVNGSPLRFWHFTKLGPTADAMTQRYARDNYPVYEIWSWYRREVKKHTDDRIPDGYWAFGSYVDGTPIPKSDRLLYRTRPELQAEFPDPFLCGAGSYRAWLAQGRGS
jgi:hypothetical protein